jgi:hypothetical protein
MKVRRAGCAQCGKLDALRSDGRLRRQAPPLSGKLCAGSGEEPRVYRSRSPKVGASPEVGATRERGA